MQSDVVIHVLNAQKSFRAHSSAYPLHVFASKIKQQGLTVKFYYQPSSSLFHCDVICIFSDFFFKEIRENPQAVVDTMRDWHGKVPTLIWFDVNDDTTNTFFEILPVVDLYVKKQVLKERYLYTQKFYNKRYFAHYYYKTLGLTWSDSNTQQRVAHPDELHKLAISWNVGLGDYRVFPNRGKILRFVFPKLFHHNRKYEPIEKDKGIHIHYRASTMQNADNAISFQRMETVKRLAIMAKDKNLSIIYEGKVPYNRYIKELRQSLVAPSPFGWGEICYRDFEIFLAGAALIKPDMSHLETWPDYFNPGVTYMPCAWDFSDFEDRIWELLKSQSLCQRIAHAGQDNYLDSISSAGRDKFISHFAGLIKQAKENLH